ncbi:aldehyde ferredoxin oxidoreductase N-terminal domain-containing protein [Chloroflexota bacterium]
MGASGYTGKILKVDLSNGKIGELSTLDYTDRFLGGRGIAARIYWDEVPPEARPFDPDNRLIFITGPLAGFPGLAGSRWQICGKSPVSVNESFSYANLGGSWGAQLKFAGYDGLVIQGKADKPVYILIRDSNIEIKDASFLWGKSTVETQEELKTIHGKGTRVAATGPAGENLVPLAIVLADEDAVGSGGFGAVMGSKNLKAVAVQGSGKVTAASPERLEELKKYVRELRRDAPSADACGLSAPFLKENPRLKKTACWGCISGCSRAIYQALDGKTGKFMCQPPWLYRDLAMKYYGEENDVPFYAVRLCDEYGFDATAIQALLIWLRRCVRKGIIKDGDLGLPTSEMGSLEFIEALFKKISVREGIGEILADGAVKAAAVMGKGAEEQLRGDIYRTGHWYPYGPRLYMLTGLLYATEPRIPIQQLHEVSFVIHEWIDWYNRVPGSFVSTDILRAIVRRFFGDETTFDFSTYEGKARAAQCIQDREYAKECSILCDFSWPMRYVKGSDDHIGDPTVEGEVLSAVTGKEIDEAGLSRLGERVFNLQRAILVREGRKGREGDTIPENDYTIPLKIEFGNPDGILPGKDGEVISRNGMVVDRGKFEQMKDEYYQLRGWDVKTGLQKREKLEELELSDVVAELDSRGLLAD